VRERVDQTRKHRGFTGFVDRTTCRHIVVAHDTDDFSVSNVDGGRLRASRRHNSSTAHDMVGDEHSALQAYQIQFNFFVAVLARPDVERRARDLVDERHGDAEPCQIDRLEIAAARVTGVDAQMIQGR
jgi:hypothetical protein